MLYNEYIKIKSLVLHNVGNKLNQDPLFFSKSDIKLEKDLEVTLTHYFLSHFKQDEHYHFFHDVELELNETYLYVSRIFDNPDTLIEQSINLAKHLYNQSTHPKIKGGEFHVVYFKDCILDGVTVDAIGLFKSENKNVFLEIEKISNGFEIESKKGIDINKLDKGCLVFNTKKEKGFVLYAIDNVNRSSEAQYWKDDFLKITSIKNEYTQTNNFLGITKQFLTKQLTNDVDISKSEQIDLLNRSVDYFKTHEEFNKDEFERNVFSDEKIIESFRNFDEVFRKENEIELNDKFEISSTAVKKQARAFKRVLKLDENFDIYIKGDKKLIEKGVDSDGRKYYKIYYDEEK
ncbi:nucleoid-associated protein [Cyclobacterium marinum]|uniref:nucleoid-associated protein n=1 Tax=Cyclobacterium marinum TaxID=104 RepID=UPI0011ECA136|nr:nucleoid-associated protein [Cyclobacterium marinum]MBI0400596.1 nucleoid-associated protein [Cyclobacterium marinum]